MTAGSEDRARLGALLRDLARELDAMEGRQGWLAALRFGVAGGLADLGLDDVAAEGFRRILATTPTHLWAWVGLIDIALRGGDAAGAAALGREGLGHLPSDMLLRRKTAEALEVAEGPAAALSVLRDQPVAAMTPDDLAYAIGLHRGAGTVPEAADLCAQLLSLRPEAAIAHLGRIEIGLQTGDAATATAAAGAALAHHSDHAEIVLRAAQAFRRAGDGARAAELAIAAPEDARFAPWFLSLRAEIAEEAGETGVAHGLWSQVCRLDLPELSKVAETALSRLSDAPAPDRHPPAPEPATVEPVAIPAEADAAPQVPDPAADVAALEAAVQQGAEQIDALFARAVSHPDLPWYLALRLVERLWTSGASTEALALSRSFADRPWPEPDRQAFAIEDLLLRVGPQAALAWIRAHPVPRRDAEGCERLGRVLLACGAGPIAARYLRACCRRWPGDGGFLRQATEALIACGQAEAVAALVDDPGCAAPEAERLGSRVAAALALGDPAAVLAACEAAERQGVTTLPRVALIEAQVLAGDLTAAEAGLARLSLADGPLEEALICRPRATRVGSLLNEARILAAMSEGVGAEADAAGLARDFFLPTRSRLLPLAAEGAADRAGDSIPDLVHLVWRGPVATPEVVDSLTGAWRASTRRDLRLHDPRNAPAWLRERIGGDAARAYAMAPDAEQKGDLMLLAVLMVEGGMAFGIDQSPSGNIDALAGPGAVVFLEGSGGVSMDALIAPPLHPLVVRAFDMAIAACLARENDHRWFKTGPGMVARALVSSLDGAAPCPMTVAGLATLRRVVHPCRPGTGLRAGGPRDQGATALRRAAERVLAAAAAPPDGA